MKLHLAVACAMAFALFPALVFAQPSLTRAAPGALAPGQTTELAIYGAKLADPLRWWTSFPGTIETLPATDAQGQPIAVKPDREKVPGARLRVRVTVSPQARLGVAGIVAATPQGVSDPLLVVIDDLSSQADAGANHSLDQAQTIPLPAAIDGLSDGVKFDYYRFAGQAGQRITVEALAGRLASPFDPVVRLLDDQGKELVFADDDPSLGVDCRFTYTCERDGEYILEVRDVRYRGGPEYHYRLRVGDFPLVTAPHPLAAMPGSKTRLNFAGLDVKGVAPLDVVVPDQPPYSRLPLSVKREDGQSSAFCELAVSSLPNLLEAEPNDSPAEANSADIPLAVNGRFDAAGDRDMFRFAAAKGQTIKVRGLSRMLGSPSYLRVRVLRRDGAKLAEAHGAAGTATLVFKPSADGEYLLSVEELLHGGGPGHAYRVELTPPAPQFSLSIKNDKDARRRFLCDEQGAVAVTVECNRAGYNGPVRLATSGADGWRLRNAVIPAKAKSAKLWIDAPRGASLGDALALRLSGKAVDGDAVDTLSAADVVRAKLPALSRVPGWLDGVLHVGVAAPVKPFFKVSLDQTNVLLPQGATDAKCSLDLKRTDKNFKEPLFVQIDGLPESIHGAVEKVGKDSDERYEATFTAAEASDGEYKIQLLAYGEFQGRVKKISLPVALQVVTPLDVNLALPEKLTVGGRAKAKILVRRQAVKEERADQDHDAPIVIRLKNLPAGVSGPGELSVTSDSDHFELAVELAAGEEAAAGSFAGVAVEVQTTYNGQELTITGQPQELKIVRK